MVRKLAQKLRRAALSRVESFLNWVRYIAGYSSEKRLSYTKQMAPGLKVHLGAGGINIQGWINIDARNLPHIHLVTENFELEEFVSDSISEIYLCHVLEHFSFAELNPILSKLHRKLRNGGLLRISVPSFDSIIEIYKNNGSQLNSIKFALMGGQDYHYNYHKSLFNKEYLTALLFNNGYGYIEEWTTVADFGVDLGDWSNKQFTTNRGNIPISLNLKARAVK
jgi:predicted SAM-dependent methyltransferase